MRIRVAAALMIGVLSALGAARAHAANSQVVRYDCDARQNLTVQRDAHSAKVEFIDRSYDLQRKPSSIGLKYTSSTAALIIDGRSAVFVAEDRLQLGACNEAAIVSLP